MGNGIWLQSEFVVVSCGADGCAQVFAMSRRFYDKTCDEGIGWTCPSGHSRVWKGETTQKKLEAAEARQRHLADQLEAAEREAEATRLRLVRDRHRFANGVCPCCNRSFENVRRHVRAMHPDYDPAALTGLPSFKCSCGRSFESMRGLRTHQGHNRSANWTKPTVSKYSRHLTVAPVEARRG